MFKTYDIRGKYPEEINTALAIFLSGKFHQFLKKNKLTTKIILAFDKKESSKSLAYAIAKSFPAPVENIGIITTPMFYHLVLKTKIPGVMITASHLNKNYNGFKFFLPSNAMWIYKNNIPEFSDKLKKNILGQLSHSVNEKTFLDYLKEIKTFQNINKKIEIDFVSNASLNYDLFNLLPKVFQNIQISKNADLKISSDFDGDRLFFYWKNKQLLPEHIFTILLLMSKHNKIGISKNISSEIINKFNDKKFFFVKTGHRYFKDAYQKYNLDFAMETSCHYYYFKELKTEAPILAVLQVLKFMEKNNLSQFLEENKFYVWRFNFKADLNKWNQGMNNLIKDISKNFAIKIKKFDGIDLQINKIGRIHIRKSNTEAMGRIFIEANSAKNLKLLKELINKKINAEKQC